VSDETTHDAHVGGHDTAHIHMPPNSIVPLFVALSLACTFIGFVDQVRNAAGPVVWGIGLIGLIASCVAWFRGARTEYLELPESEGEQPSH
jgi:threonine dehydrogenase-like Zn-dependent dehydrogenase